MKAIAVIPGEKNSARLLDVPVPDIDDNEVLVRSVRAGVCSTDREVHKGLYGTAPSGEDYLILGHESFGVVEFVGRNVSGFKKGQYVVRTVRRPCSACDNCSSGASDVCSTGNFSESGIKELHGCMAEYFKDDPNYLIPVPAELADLSVLLEPMSVVEKVLRQSYLIQRRLEWKPKNAMIIGAGPIGLLQAMLLVENGMTVNVVARSPPFNLKSKLVASIGARYISTSYQSLDEAVRDIGHLDLIVEASGNSTMAFAAMENLENNGVLCLTSITGGKMETVVASDKINLDLVLGNKVVFGTVNANIVDYQNGLRSLEKFANRWPDVLPAMFTRRVPLQQYAFALENFSEDIKTTIEIS
ncbi:glucose 1-dehydrogenase [Candidatus Woesearchaeota archaeon]|nr:glucose 1-dehydrogenase [Candidatus Woesearchaeota archaeon]